MAKVKNLDKTGYLKFKDGTPIDSSLFENDPLDSTLNDVEAIPDEEKRASIKKLLPDAKLPPVK